MDRDLGVFLKPKDGSTTHSDEEECGGGYTVEGRDGEFCFGPDMSVGRWCRRHCVACVVCVLCLLWSVGTALLLQESLLVWLGPRLNHADWFQEKSPGEAIDKGKIPTPRAVYN